MKPLLEFAQPILCNDLVMMSLSRLLEVVLDDGDEVLGVDDALEGGAPDDGLVGEALDGARAGGGQREGGRRGAVARLLQFGQKPTFNIQLAKIHKCLIPESSLQTTCSSDREMQRHEVNYNLMNTIISASCPATTRETSVYRHSAIYFLRRCNANNEQVAKASDNCNMM